MSDPTDVVPESRRPNMGEWFNVSVEALKGKIRCALPGRVEAYDSNTQRAAVKPLLQGLLRNADGSTTSTSIGVLNEVPVLMLQGGGVQVKLPVAKGDIVLLVFCDRSLDIWKAKGGEVDPVDLRQHHLSDAVAIPCLRDPTAAPTAKIEIQPDGTVLLGGAATHPLIFGDDFSAVGGAFDTLVKAISTAVGGIPGGGGAASAITTALGLYQTAVLAKLSSAVKTA
jgi:hypothetical protein